MLVDGVMWLFLILCILSVLSKISWIIGLLLVLWSCQAEKQTEDNSPPVPLKKAELWGLTSYMDSIVTNKKIADYRIQSPSWFAILIHIKEDSIFCHGSILDSKAPLVLNKDTLAVFKNFTGKWMLLDREEELLLQQFPDQPQKDSTVYSYQLRNDLHFLTENLDPVHHISSNIEAYFHENILVGKYINTRTGDTINFQKNGQLVGFSPYTKFKIKNYFGTHHPHKNKDVVYFETDQRRPFQQYHWQIEGDSLLLTEFVADTTREEGQLFMPDQFELGTTTLLFIKQNYFLQ